MNIANKTAYFPPHIGGNYYAVLLEIFILYSAVKEFGKSVKI